MADRESADLMLVRRGWGCISSWEGWMECWEAVIDSEGWYGREKEGRAFGSEAEDLA